jgi:hypothetical protein
MSRIILSNWATSYKWTIAVLEMGVECEPDAEWVQEPPSDRGEIGISHSA